MTIRELLLCIAFKKMFRKKYINNIPTDSYIPYSRHKT